AIKMHANLCNLRAPELRMLHKTTNLSRTLLLPKLPVGKKFFHIPNQRIFFTPAILISTPYLGEE
ncbi:MAG: hypothetical protein ACRDCT_24300, partial [Shewanella sp.]